MADELVLIRMQLNGGKEVAAEADLASGSIKKVTTAADEANAASTRSAKKAESATAGIAASMKSHAATMKTLGASMTRYVSVPLLGIGVASGVMAANFQRQMSLVATDAGGSRKEVNALEGQVLDLAKNTQFGPTKLAESLFHVESSGYRGAKAMKVLNEAQKLATAGNSELQATTYALVSATKALNSGDSLAGVTKVAAQLNEIVSHGDIRLEELTSAMSTGLLPTAKALGLSVADVGSALDVMTKRGIPAQRAAYALNFTLQKLIPSTDKAKEAFASLGLGEEQLLKTAQTKGLPTALALLKSKLAPLTKGGEVQAIDEMFGGGRMSKGLLVAIQHTGEMKTLWGEVDGNVGLYRDHVKEAEEQSLVKLKTAWSNIQTALVEIGVVILPVLVPMVEKLAGWIVTLGKGFSGLPKPLQSIALALGAALIVGGPLLIFFGHIAGAIAILGPLAIRIFGGMAGAMGDALLMMQLRLADRFPAIAALFSKWGVTSGRLFDIGVVAGAALLGVWVGTQIYAHLSHNTKRAMHDWAWTAGENFVNFLVDAINKGLDESNVLAFAGIEAPEVGHVNWHHGHNAIEQQRGKAKNAIHHGMFEGPGGKLIPAPQKAEGAINFGGGMALVGEKGPELAYLPEGVDIMPAGPTQRWRAEAAGNRPSHEQPVRQRRLRPIQLILDRKVIAEATIAELEDAEARA